MKKVFVYGLTETFGGVEKIILDYIKHIDTNMIQFDFVGSSVKPKYLDSLKNLSIKYHQIPNITRNFRNTFRNARRLLKSFLNNCLKKIAQHFRLLKRTQKNLLTKYRIPSLPKILNLPHHVRSWQFITCSMPLTVE